MAIVDFIDGLFEGHEGPGVRWIYRLVIVSITILSAFCIVMNPVFVIAKKPGSTADPLINSLATAGFLALMFMNIAWYRRENQSPGHRYAIYFLMVCIVVLDIASCIAFNRVATYEEPVPVIPPTAAPTTTLPPGPTQPTTTAPNRSLLHRFV